MKTKRICVWLMLSAIILSLFPTLPCHAWQDIAPLMMPTMQGSGIPHGEYWGYGGEEYKAWFQEYSDKVPDNFVSPLTMEFLGFFGDYRIYRPRDSYFNKEYAGELVVWKYQYEFEMTRTETAIYTAVIEIRHCKMDEIEATASLDALADSADMRLLDASYHGEEQNIRLGSAIYHYDAEGRLRWIKWEDGNRTFTLTVDTFEYIRDSYWWNREGDMADCESEGIVADLLNPKTAKGALREFRMRVALGGVSDETYIVIAVCAVAIALVVIFLIMRKKRGALAPAVAGAPAGEVSAGSEGDVSAASALPESPTPPEAAATDAPPPEETPPPEG